MNERRICVIGNSHAGAIKLAWQQSPELHQANRMTFFVAAQDRMRNMVVGNRRIAPSKSDEKLLAEIRHTSGGKTGINIADYDAFLFVGLDLHFYRIYRYYALHRIYEHFSDADRRQRLISRAFLAQVMEDVLARQWGFDLIRRVIAAAEGSTCIVHHTPAPSIKILDSEGKFARLMATPLKTLHDEQLLGFVGEEARRVFESYCSFIGAVPLPQPASTIDRSGFTADTYSEGRKFAGQSSTSADYYHMNAEYGMLVLGDFIERVSSISSPRQAPARDPAAPADHVRANP